MNLVHLRIIQADSFLACAAKLERTALTSEATTSLWEHLHAKVNAFIEAWFLPPGIEFSLLVILSQRFHFPAGRALSQQELDEECEAFLQQRYGESLDFAIENSLPFLLRDGLISRNAQARLLLHMLYTTRQLCCAHACNLACMCG